MPVIYHITTKEEWKKALEKGFYTAPSLETEGFIHCSEESQVEGVLKRYYKGVADLQKLHIETGKLTSTLKYELAPSVHEHFPHIYGPINLDAVVNVQELEDKAII
jgi:uncharacterized protein (DUF952 family)